MFCPSCGSEVNPNAVVCVKCGCPISNQQQQRPYAQNNTYNQNTSYNNNAYNQNTGYNNNAYNQNAQYYNNAGGYAGGYAGDDFASGGLKFLCFIIPILGIILYATENSARPNKAKECLKMAIISICISVGCSIFFSIIAALIPMLY